ncbi:MAG: hypothetical protein PHE55_21165 [Methylococcaceae bacterium]|nr:hypothetical protein [Methylococcaceae bacterium]
MVDKNLPASQHYSQLQNDYKLGRDWVYLAEFVWRLEWGDKVYDGGYGLFCLLVKAGLPIFDAYKRVDSNEIMARAMEAYKKEVDAIFAPDNQDFLDYHKDKDCWADWLSDDTRRYVIRRKDAARVYFLLGRDEFPWVNAENKPVLLAVVDYLPAQPLMVFQNLITAIHGVFSHLKILMKRTKFLRPSRYPNIQSMLGDADTTVETDYRRRMAEMGSKH